MPLHSFCPTLYHIFAPPFVHVTMTCLKVTMSMKKERDKVLTLVAESRGRETLMKIGTLPKVSGLRKADNMM